MSIIRGAYATGSDCGSYVVADYIDSVCKRGFAVKTHSDECRNNDHNVCRYSGICYAVR